MINFNMSSLLNQTKAEYEITRTSKAIVKGVSTSTGNTTFTTNMTVTNAKKDDLITLGMGNTTKLGVKVRVLNSDVAVAVGDKFNFQGNRFEITRPRPYAEGITDFKIFFAFMEVVR